MAPFLLVATLALGCTTIDLDARMSGRGGAGGTGATGGGGMTPWPYAPSWVPFVDGAYGFEGETLGHDDSEHGNDLAPRGAPTASSEAQQGTTALATDAGPPSNGLVSNPAALAASATGVTYGGFMQVSVESVENPPYNMLMGKFGLAIKKGYLMEIFADQNPLEQVSCAVGRTADWDNATSTSILGPSEWFHAVCRLHAASGVLHLLKNGVAERSIGSAVYHEPNSPFEINAESFGAGARFDDVFVVAAPLSDEAIRRIWACNLDGSRCLCNDTTPSLFDDCGRAEPTCDGLPACDTAEPPLMP